MPRARVAGEWISNETPAAKSIGTKAGKCMHGWSLAISTNRATNLLLVTPPNDSYILPYRRR
ncbi:MAG TPA: hypothetical protein VFZ59_16500 [Verrucomicrobiae bacterium]|nr:hypothetical protein [Verrucomicrobiae bacterium]